MAKLFTTSRTINHFLWEFFTALHKATPFHGKTHKTINKSTTGENGDCNDESGSIFFFTFQIFPLAKATFEGMVFQPLLCQRQFLIFS